VSDSSVANEQPWLRRAGLTGAAGTLRRPEMRRRRRRRRGRRSVETGRSSGGRWRGNSVVHRRRVLKANHIYVCVLLLRWN